MLLQKKSLPKSRIKLTVAATAAHFRSAFDKELESVAAQTKLPGFRPGKAPKKQVLQKVGRSRIEAGALDQAVSEAYFEALTQEKISPVAPPAIEIEKFEVPAENAADDAQVATFTAEVDIFPEIKLDGYKKIKAKSKTKKEVKEDEVEKVLIYLEKQQASLQPAEDGTALENGMWADIAYEGSVGGVKRADMAAKNHPLVIGEGQLIPGFEDGMLGMKAGEERTVSVTFPKDYQASELSGKKAEFKVTVNEIKKVQLPERNDAFAATFGHKTMAELEKAILQNLHEEKEHEERHQLEETVMEELLKLAKFDVPASLVDQELERMVKDTEERLQKMNFNWDNYLQQVKKTREEVREEMRTQAEKNVRLGLALGQVMKEEGISEKDGGGQAAVQRLLEIATAEK